MLTVNHTVHGSERIYTAENAVYYGPFAVGETAISQTPYVGLDAGHISPPRELRDGVVFVMNESGKTVAKYDLRSTDVARTPIVPV